MIKSALSRSVFVLALCALLPACQDMRRAVGFEKVPPDEFQVVQRAPLAVPPDFTLRPPAPGTVRPQEGTPRDQARAALVGPARSQAITTQNRDSTDIALLKKAGVDGAQRDIRDLVDKETLAQTKTDKSFTEKIMFWQPARKPGDGEQLNADAEAARLKPKTTLANGSTDGVNPRIEKGSHDELPDEFEYLKQHLPDGLPDTFPGIEGSLDWLRWPF